MKTHAPNSMRLILVGLCALCSILAHELGAAVWYWDPNGTSAVTSGTWDNSTLQWSTTSALTDTLSAWNSANAAGFPAGTVTNSALTITVNSPIGMGGIFNGGVTSSQPGVTNLTFSGSGSFSLNPGICAFSTENSFYNTIIKLPITGSGQLQTQSGGSLYLSGNNTYSGGTSFDTSAGCNFNNGNVFGSGALTNTVSQVILATPATDSAGNTFATAPITLPNNLTTCGAAGSSSIIFVGLAAAPTTFSGLMTLANPSGTTFTFQNQPSGTTVTISGAISGAGNFTKAGAGTLVLSGANTYSGNTAINSGGTLTIGGAGKLGNGTYAGTIANSGAFIYSSSAAQTLSGVISGAGTITQNGSGTLTLSGVNTYSGTTTINGGALSISADSGLGAAPGTATAGSVTLNGGTLQHTSSGIGSTFINGNRGIALGANGGTLNLSSSGAILIYTSGQITGSGNTLTKAGPGTLRVTTPTSVTFSKLRVTGGLYQAGADTIFGAVPGSSTADAITLNGGGVSVNAGFTFSANRGITLGASGGTFDGASSATVAGVISGAGSLTKTGTGTFTLTGANTYSGDTTISAGAITLNGSSTLGAGTLHLSGGTLATSASRTPSSAPVANALDLTTDSIMMTTSTANPAELNLSSSTIGGSAGTLTFSNGNNSASGLFNPRFSGSGFTFGRPINIANGGAGSTTVLNSYNATGTDQSFTGVISGSGSFVRNASTAGTGGRTIFTRANTYTGGTTVNHGTLQVDNTTGSGTGTGAVTVNSDGTLAGTGIIAGAVSVAGRLAPGDAGIGTLTFGSSLSLSGTTSMEINKATGLADKVVMSSGTATLGGNLTIVNVGGSLALGDTFDLFDGPLAGTFSSFSLPSLPAGLTWDTSQLSVGGNGTIKVVCDGSLAASAGASQTICYGASVTIGDGATAHGGSGGGYSYLWSPSTGLSSSTVANPTASPTNTTAYTVTVTDANGCTATSSPVTVTVDTTPPVLTVLGGNPLTNECRTAFVDPGATAQNSCGSTLSVSTNGAVDADTVGLYTITYWAIDPSGSATTNTRAVYIVDTTPPVVTVLGANPLTNECHSGFVDPGATASDTYAGSLSVSTNGTVDVNTVGRYTLSYWATDPSGNAMTNSRTVYVVDTTAPTLTAGTIAACYASTNEAQAAAIAATTVQDACDSSPTIVASTVGTCSAVVTVTAIDASGNQASVTYNTQVIAPPVFGAITATEGAANVKDCAATTVQGTVNLSVPVSAPCGLNGGQPSVTVANGSVTEAPVFDGESPAGTYHYHWTVTTLTSNGTWTATVIASEACQSATTQFRLCMNNAQISGQVQLEGFVGTATEPTHTRAVTFVATDGPGAGATVLKTWTLALTNLSGDTFAYTLSDAPRGTRGLSAITAWNLRSKVPVTLDANGQATSVNFTGSKLLRGGDFDGNNLTTFDDYSVLGKDFFSFNSTPDITGDGQVDFDDYAIFAANWQLMGDPE